MQMMKPDNGERKEEESMKIIRMLRGPFLDPEQECRFEEMMEKRCWKYFLPIGLSILVFQIYNILYALQYTGFRLDTAASRIYVILYLFLLLVSGTALMFRKFVLARKKEKSHLALSMYQCYGVILLLWSACVTVYDQRVSDNLNVYTVVALGTAMLVYMKPVISIPGFLAAELLVLLGMPRFQPGGVAEHYGTYLNSVVLAATAIAVSVYRYGTVRSEFQKQELIESQNQEILRKSEELNYMANHDALTGLWNRRFLEFFLDGLFCQKNEIKMAVLMIDVDYFKQYNDTYGHQKGDECLKRIAGAMKLVVSRGRLFRYGGEEFVCVVPGYGREDGKKLGEELCRCVRRLGIEASDPGKYVTVSVGITAGTVKQREDFDRLLGKADSALYQAKINGRNRAAEQ